jgi:hypothetical protein
MNQQYTNPKEWGPHFWFVFRCIANNYPESPSEDDIKYTKTFFYAFQHILPCVLCKESYIQHFNKYNLDEYLINNKKLIEWVELIYNETTNKIKSDIINPSNKTISTQRGCPSCNKNKVPHDESLFPQINERNTGINLGKIGALRYALATTDIPNKNMLLSFYNWIRIKHTLPLKTDAINIMKGYIILKNLNTLGFYPDFFKINGTDISLIEQNSYILTDSKISQLVYDKFKRLSI